MNDGTDQTWILRDTDRLTIHLRPQGQADLVLDGTQVVAYLTGKDGDVVDVLAAAGVAVRYLNDPARPPVIDAPVGNLHVTRALDAQVAAGRVGRAYLLSGPRGSGKIATARRFAATLNRPDSVFDAAAINGAEDLAVAVGSGAGRVLIVDEAHMLSVAATNLLAGWLVDPPRDVVFVLTTTDPLKFRSDILARVQHFDLRRPAA